MKSWKVVHDQNSSKLILSGKEFTTLSEQIYFFLQEEEIK